MSKQYSDTDENYLKWIAPSKYGTTHGAELIHEFGAYKNEEYGEPFAWEYDAGEAFGSRINAIINSDQSLSAFEWKPYSENESFSVVRTGSTDEYVCLSKVLNAYGTWISNQKHTNKYCSLV